MLRTAAVIAAVAAPIAASAQATTTMIEGFNPRDPVGSASREVMRLLRAQCDLGDKRVVVGVASEPIEKQVLTRDQGNHIMGQVHAAFSRLPNIRLIDFKDVGALEDVRRVGMTRTANAGNVDDLINQAEVRVIASGQRVGKFVRFALRAIHRDISNCDVSTPTVELSTDQIGEIFLPPEVIFESVAKDIWARSRGVNHVVMQSRASGGAPIDPHLPEFFRRQMTAAVARSKDENAALRETEVVVATRADDGIDPAVRWDTDVTLEPRSNGFRLTVEARRPNTTALVSEGLLAPSDLPSQRRSDLVRQASMIRQAAPPPPRGGQGAPGGARIQRASSGDAAVINVAGTPTRIQDSVDDQTGEQRYAFQLFRESFVEFDIVKISGKQISFKPELFGSNGMPVDSFPPGRARINLRRYRLPPGAYELRVTPEERGRHDFVLATRAASTSAMLDFEPVGRLSRRFNDWFAGERQIDGGRICFAYTQAIEVSPTSWREQRPYIWIAINGDRRIQEIAHFIDDATRYDRNADLKVSFEDQNGGMRPLNAKVIAGAIQPAIANARGEPILDRESVRGYTQGASILVEGKTADGKEASVRYSLVGYRAAINAAALNCGRPDLAQDLVWRR